MLDISGQDSNYTSATEKLEGGMERDGMKRNVGKMNMITINNE